MKRRFLRITAIMIIFVFAFSFNGISGVIEDEIQHSGNTERPELNSSNISTPNVVEVSMGTSFESSQTNEEEALTPIQTATSIASGMIASGTTDESVIKATLVSYGYEVTEAEIAYAKAITSDILAVQGEITAVQTEITAVQGEITAVQGTPIQAVQGEIIAVQGEITAVQGTPIQAVQGEITAVQGEITAVQGEIKAVQATAEEATAVGVKVSVEDEIEKVSSSVVDTQSSEVLSVTPTVAAKDRVKQTLKPNSKFKRGVRRFGNRGQDQQIKASKDEIDTVKGMLSEGYSLDQIAEGFAENHYSSKDTAALFKEAGVSSIDAYEALSSNAVKKAEAKAGKVRPKSKFAKRFGIKQSDPKQDAIKATINDLESAGYDVQGALDVAVQDLKDSGMSTQETKDFLIKKVADGTGKPKSKFRKILGKKSTKPSYGQGEISLATAMIKAGYSSVEVESALQSGSHSYTSGNAHMIVSAGERIASGNATADLKPVSSNNINSNTEDLINKRNTSAIPI